MKYFYKILFCLTLCLIGQTPVLARDVITDWYIKDLKTEIVVNQDSSLDITENILADCGTLPNKHGIFRVLPRKYKTIYGNFNLPTTLVSITNNGAPVRYSVDSSADTITYKIGDPNYTVSGQNNYQIKYRVENAIRTNNQKFDELYWNVLGSYWDLEIDNFSATIVFPDSINKDNTKISYYAGNYGSKESNLAAYSWSSDNILEIISNGSFLKNQGITLSVAFPKNILAPYQATLSDKLNLSSLDIFLLPIIIVLLLTVIFYYRKKFHFNFDFLKNFNKTIVPEFEIPENLTPIEMGAVIEKGQLNKNSIAATVVHLGFLGYLRIERVEKKVLIFKTSEFKIINTDKLLGPDLNELEKFILSVILGTTKEVTLDNIGLTVSSHFMEITRKLGLFLEDRGYFDSQLEKRKQAGLALLFVLFLFSVFLVIYFFSIAFLLITVVVLVAFFSLIFKSCLTVAGKKMDERITGFKLYMKTAEKYRSEFQEKNDILDKLLPYAILFGITTEWLDKMKEICGEDYINNYSPAFMDSSLGLIGFNSFISTVSDISNGISDGVASAVASSNSSSMSGFGGGGSVGGGGGGGGGGGW